MNSRKKAEDEHDKNEMLYADIPAEIDNINDDPCRHAQSQCVYDSGRVNVIGH